MNNITIHQGLIRDFSKISIHNRMDPFFDADITQYMGDPNQFSLNLKRVPGQVVLYGHQHVSIRQQFFNSLTSTERIELFNQKIDAIGAKQWIENTAQVQFDSLTDVCDVGKGRSIYKFTCSNDRSFIFKAKVNKHQQTFHEIASLLSIPISKSWFFENDGLFFECTEFIPSVDRSTIKVNDDLVVFAKAAAVGDVLCVGDRHFDNYLFNNLNELVCIDVSNILDDDHDLWTKKYIAGGLYECCLLKLYVKDANEFKRYLTQFFEAYCRQASRLLDEIQFIQLNGCSDNVQFILKTIKNRWPTKTFFYNHMQSLYSQSMGDMIERLVYAQLLQQLVDANVNLTEYPELLMYSLAHEEQPGLFFRLNDVDAPVLDQITMLANDHLGVTNQYLIDAKDGLEASKQVVRQLRFDLT